MNSRRTVLHAIFLSLASPLARAGVLDWYNGVKLGTKLPQYDAHFINESPPTDVKLQLIDFWATWCAPCRENIPRLNTFYRDFKDRGLSVIGLTQESVEVAKPFLSKVSMLYSVGAGKQNSLQGALGVKALPYAVFVNSASTIIWRGQPEEIDAALIESLLKSAA